MTWRPFYYELSRDLLVFFYHLYLCYKKMYIYFVIMYYYMPIYGREQRNYFLYYTRSFLIDTHVPYNTLYKQWPLLYFWFNYWTLRHYFHYYYYYFFVDYQKNLIIGIRFEKDKTLYMGMCMVILQVNAIDSLANRRVRYLQAVAGIYNGWKESFLFIKT